MFHCILLITMAISKKKSQTMCKCVQTVFKKVLEWCLLIERSFGSGLVPITANLLNHTAKNGFAMDHYGNLLTL